MEKPFSFGIKLKFKDKLNTKYTFLECVNEQHNKFLYITYTETPENSEHPFLVTTHFGKMGTHGQLKKDKFKTEDLARSFIARKIKEKTGPSKGYIKVIKPTNPLANLYQYGQQRK